MPCPKCDGFARRFNIRTPNGRASVQIAICCLNRSSPRKGAGRCAAEVVDGFEAACRGDLKDRTIVRGPAQCGCPVKLPIAGEYQSCIGFGAVRAQRACSAELVERGRLARSSGKFENRALGGAAAHLCCSEEVPIRALK